MDLVALGIMSFSLACHTEMAQRSEDGVRKGGEKGARKD